MSYLNGSDAKAVQGNTDQRAFNRRALNKSRGLFYSRIDKAAKIAAAVIAPFRAVQYAAGLMETYAAFLQGKGGGSGWDGENESKALSTLVPNRPLIVLDVGANDGRWSVEFANSHGNKDSRFFLIECAPYCFAGIEKRLPCIPNPTVLKCAMSDSIGMAKLQIPTQGSGLASFYVRNDVSVVQHTYTTLEVETRTLDNVAESEHLDRVDILKMDIEGHELAALRGARGLLSKKKIAVIQFEFGSANVNAHVFFRELWDLLHTHNFKLYRIVPGGRAFPVTEYNETLEYFRGATNYIAVLK